MNKSLIVIFILSAQNRCFLMARKTFGRDRRSRQKIIPNRHKNIVLRVIVFSIRFYVKLASISEVTWSYDREKSIQTKEKLLFYFVNRIGYVHNNFSTFVAMQQEYIFLKRKLIIKK